MVAEFMDLQSRPGFIISIVMVSESAMQVRMDEAVANPKPPTLFFKAAPAF